jgi:hypothetical protein
VRSDARALDQVAAHDVFDPLRAAGVDLPAARRPRARPRRLPARGSFACAQVWPDGAVREFAARIRGRAWAGSLDVEHEAGSVLGEWLAAGRHPAVFVSGTQLVGPAGPPRR